MKKILVLVAAIIVGCTGKKEELNGTFIVKGKLSNITTPVIVKLNYRDDKNLPVFDEVISENGEFTFKGNTTASDAVLMLAPYHPKYKMTSKEYWDFAGKELEKKQYKTTRSFLLESAVYEFVGTDDLAGATLETDSKEQKLFDEYNTEMDKMVVQAQNISSESDRDSTDVHLEWIKNEQAKQVGKIHNFIFAFVKKHPESKVSLAALKTSYAHDDTDELELALNGLAKELQDNPAAKTLKKIVTTANINGLGKEAIPFTLEDPKGDKHSLNSFKGKYVLIDFWSSWCAPCRAENPNVLKAYNNYKNKNFDIISISLDSDKGPWLKAVAQDKLPWLNLIDEKGEKSVSKAYGVLAIPTNFLLDPSGNIIAKNLIGKKLHSKLAEELK